MQTHPRRFPTVTTLLIGLFGSSLFAADPMTEADLLKAIASAASQGGGEISLPPGTIAI